MSKEKAEEGVAVAQDPAEAVEQVAQTETAAAQPSATEGEAEQEISSKKEKKGKKGKKKEKKKEKKKDKKGKKGKGKKK